MTGVVGVWLHHSKCLVWLDCQTESYRESVQVGSHSLLFLQYVYKAR